MAAAKFSRYFTRFLWALGSVLFALYYFWSSINTALVIIRTPFVWSRSYGDFVISQERDNFDVTFLNYSRTRDTCMPEYEDLIPPILHHISLGNREPDPKWLDAKQSCDNYHPGWESYVWTDGNAAKFVEEYFPDYKGMWDSYKFPIERIDALRYMVLYVYGGTVLDMDLKCTRSLGPLRRFDFVAPAAHPMGFSIGFMMASQHNPFVGELIRNLPAYDKNWFGLPYPAVMFSTGCHYASAIHTLQRDRSTLKILAGPKEDPTLHSLNGDVITPLFHHLGSSSWHSFDAQMIVAMGHAGVWIKIFVILGLLSGVLLVVMRLHARGKLSFSGRRAWWVGKIPAAEFDGREA